MDERAATDPSALASDPLLPGTQQTSKAGLRTTFRELADTWRGETGGLSSPMQIAAHPAYQCIIGMGEQALPYIFEELRERGGQWYVALGPLCL